MSNMNYKITKALEQEEKQGDADSQYKLGLLYENGEGVTHDYREAVYWYTKSAEQGHTSAQNNLGYMYNHGHGTTKDDEQSVYWYNKAAEQGDYSYIKKTPFYRGKVI